LGNETGAEERGIFGVWDGNFVRIWEDEATLGIETGPSRDLDIFMPPEITA
jgi:hypothetical protein